MKRVTEKQIEEAIACYYRADNMHKRIIMSKNFNDLSNREYSRAKYWEGKIIGLEDVFDILGVSYRQK